MDTNKMRDELLEQAFDRLGDDKGQGLHPYFKDAFRRGWEEAWRLSREAVAVELPAAEFGVSPEIEGDEEYEAAEAISMCEDAVLSRVRKHIEAQGLKVAP